VVYLGQHPDAAKNAKLDLATVEAMLPLAGLTEHTARSNLLERGFVIATKESANWEKAARFIVVLDDPGIDRNLATLNDKQAKLLAKGARSAPDSGATDERLIGRIRAKIKREAPGQLFGKVTATLEPHDGDADRHVRFSCRARIVFEPDGDVVDATKIAFVQTLRLTGTGRRPTITAARAGASLTPSPNSSTRCPSACRAATTSSLSWGRSPARTSVMPTPVVSCAAARGLSPVSRAGECPVTDVSAARCPEHRGGAGRRHRRWPSSDRRRGGAGGNLSVAACPYGWLR
jgi:hypothetical protein